jgi:hypothetical protein
MTDVERDAVADMVRFVEEQCTTVDLEQRFRDMLDECYSFDSVGGPFSSMSPSDVLKQVDPVQFRCGVNDYGDGEFYDIDGSAYDVREVDEARDEYIDNLEMELSDAETALEDLEAEHEDDEDYEPDTSEVDRLNAMIEACKKYVF